MGGSYERKDTTSAAPPCGDDLVTYPIGLCEAYRKVFRYKFENALIRLFDTGRLEYDFHDLMEFMVYGLHQKGGEEKGLNSAFGTALTDAGAGDTICRQVFQAGVSERVQDYGNGR